MDGDPALVDWRENSGLNGGRFQAAIASLLLGAGLEGDFILRPVEGGANNRIFRVVVGAAETLLKVYFQHPDDPRDRLGAEFSFSRFAWGNGLRSLPRPLACDPQNHLALYEFLQGRQLRPHEITEVFVRQALNFYQELNRHKRLPETGTLPKASEACFSIAEHLQCVERRLRNLRDVDESSAINCEAASFIKNEMAVAWRRIVDDVRKGADELHLSLNDEIPWHDRCLSPSDFGFHNAVVSSDDRLRFIDFEYAGWDDPAKMVCDFFCQPAVPVSMDYYDFFVHTVVSSCSKPEIYLQRMALLFPAYQLKWCCILLNEFLAEGEERRRFARGDLDGEERKSSQLKKARCALRNLMLSSNRKDNIYHKHLSKA